MTRYPTLERHRTPQTAQTDTAGSTGRTAPGLTARVCAALIAVIVLTVALLVAWHPTLHALNAAGAFKGSPIGGVQTFVEKLKGNLVWLGGTAMGLVIAVVGIMFMAGHSRAHDIAIRTIAGLAILASISGIVA